MNKHDEYHYSVTIKTHDEAVLNCLRALSQYAQSSGNLRIIWGGTKREDWNRAKHCVTFHFLKPEYRKIFIREVSRLLPKDLWDKIDEKDDDPAIPQSKTTSSNTI